VVGKSDSIDQAIARIARRQHGIVTAAQLGEVGLSRAAISKRVKAGRLHRLHQGIYAVGHLGLSNEAIWMGAVLACGPGAVLSHMAAACLWGLLRWEGGPVDVSVPTYAGRKRRRGIRVHRRLTLGPQGMAPLSTTGLQRRQARQVTVRSRIPVTTPARTVRDLRGAVAPYLERRAIRQADYIGLPLDGVKTDGTRSDLEGDFLRLWRRRHQAIPEVNVRVGRWTVDFLWRERRLVVETDSYVAHRGAAAFEDDHVRDAELRRAGFAVHRFSERQLEREPAAVMADVAAALRRART
jgi:very-short-patch-repair endonuclease